MDLFFAVEGNANMDLTVAREVEVLGKVNEGIDLLAFVGRSEVDFAFANVVSTNGVLVKNAEVELVVLGTFFDGESESLVPDWVVLVLQDLSLLLVVFI